MSTWQLPLANLPWGFHPLFTAECCLFQILVPGWITFLSAIQISIIGSNIHCSPSRWTKCNPCDNSLIIPSRTSIGRVCELNNTNQPSLISRHPSQLLFSPEFFIHSFLFRSSFGAETSFSQRSMSRRGPEFQETLSTSAYIGLVSRLCHTFPNAEASRISLSFPIMRTGWWKVTSDQMSGHPVPKTPKKNFPAGYAVSYVLRKKREIRRGEGATVNSLNVRGNASAACYTCLQQALISCTSFSLHWCRFPP